MGKKREREKEFENKLTLKQHPMTWPLSLRSFSFHLLTLNLCLVEIHPNSPSARLYFLGLGRSIISFIPQYFKLLSVRNAAVNHLCDGCNYLQEWAIDMQWNPHISSYMQILSLPFKCLANRHVQHWFDLYCMVRSTAVTSVMITVLIVVAVLICTGSSVRTYHKNWSTSQTFDDVMVDQS